MNDNMAFSEYSKIIIPGERYNAVSDKRLLIPFMAYDMFGFLNSQGQIVIKAQYSLYYDDCYSIEDTIRVAKLITFGFSRSNGRVDTYKKYLWGLLNSEGKEILPWDYDDLIRNINNRELFTAKKNGGYAVIDKYGNIIVPYGKYQYIDGFDRGLARVNVYGKGEGLEKFMYKWGLINERGEEVLPPIYDSIWNFYGKNKQTTRVVKEGHVFDYNLT